VTTQADALAQEWDRLELKGGKAIVEPGDGLGLYLPGHANDAGRLRRDVDMK
jgi:hypothetical protein